MSLTVTCDIVVDKELHLLTLQERKKKKKRVGACASREKKPSAFRKVCKLEMATGVVFYIEQFI